MEGISIRLNENLLSKDFFKGLFTEKFTRIFSVDGSLVFCIFFSYYSRKNHEESLLNLKLRRFRTVLEFQSCTIHMTISVN